MPCLLLGLDLNISPKQAVSSSSESPAVIDSVWFMNCKMPLETLEKVYGVVLNTLTSFSMRPTGLLGRMVWTQNIATASHVYTVQV